MSPRFTLAVLITVGCLLAGACSDDDERGTPREVTNADDTATLAVADQSAGEQLVVDRAVVPSPGGYAVVYESRNGAPGPVLGSSSLLSTGEHTDVEVDLTNAPEAGTEVFVMLHAESSGDGELEYPGPDEPISVDGSVLTVTATLD